MINPEWPQDRFDMLLLQWPLLLIDPPARFFVRACPMPQTAPLLCVALHSVAASCQSKASDRFETSASWNDGACQGISRSHVTACHWGYMFSSAAVPRILTASLALACRSVIWTLSQITSSGVAAVHSAVTFCVHLCISMPRVALAEMYNAHSES